MINCCAVVPVYNHEHAIGAVVAALRAHDLAVVLVDDASSPECAAVLDALRAADTEHIHLERHPVNQGKGGAVMTGFKRAAALGFSHALQIDADGQHDSGAIPSFVDAAERAPEAVICGYPVYDESVPKHRLYGRYATHIWIWINTLSFRIKDSMCGFRIYPLAPVLPLVQEGRIGKRMDFDSEILVRLDWKGVPIVNLPTRVGYPSDGVSHFRLWLDNALISRMHAKLFFGMLLRSPLLLWRHVAPKRRRA